MKTSVLEFKLRESLFCFNTKHIEYVFELEEYEELQGFDKSVVGMTKYNDDVIVLVDTAELYSSEALDLTQPKSVVVFVDDEKKRYGLLVDEIVKIEEIESVHPSVDLNTEDMIVNHYKDKNEGGAIISEIFPLPLFKSHNIPAVLPKTKESTKSLSSQEHTKQQLQSYLLFSMNNRRYAIAAKEVSEVLELEGEIFDLESEDGITRGAISVREEVIGVVLPEGISQISEVLVIEHEENKFGICVESIDDIELFFSSKIEFFKEAQNGVSGFYNFKGEVVGIISSGYFLKKLALAHKSQKVKEAQNLQSTKKYDYLLFSINTKRYAIAMEYVRQVVETATLSKTHSAAIVANRCVEFLTTWNHQAVEILHLKEEFGEISKSQESESIFLEYGGHTVAFMVDEIDNIVYLELEDITETKTQKTSVIDGAIVHEGSVIPRVNPFYIAELG